MDITIKAPKNNAMLGESTERNADSSKSYNLTITCSIILWSVVLIILMIISILITKSFHHVDYAHYGLVSNTYDGVEHNKVYSEGEYFKFLDDKMLYFDSTFNDVSYSMSIFADTGVEFIIDVEFRYKVPMNSLSNLYNLHSNDYPDRIKDSAIKTSKNIASTYSVDDYLSYRNNIEYHIASNVETVLIKDFGVIVPIEFFKLIKIYFPQTLIQSGLNNAIAYQNSLIEIEQRTIDLIVANTHQMLIEIETEITKTVEFAHHNATLIIDTADYNSNQLKLTARTNGIDILVKSLNISDSSEKIRISKIFAIQDNKNNVTIIDTTNSIII